MFSACLFFRYLISKSTFFTNYIKKKTEDRAASDIANHPKRAAGCSSTSLLCLSRPNSFVLVTQKVFNSFDGERDSNRTWF